MTRIITGEAAAVREEIGRIARMLERPNAPTSVECCRTASPRAAAVIKFLVSTAGEAAQLIKDVHTDDLDLLTFMAAVQQSATKRRIVATNIRLASAAASARVAAATKRSTT